MSTTRYSLGQDLNLCFFCSYIYLFSVWDLHPFPAWLSVCLLVRTSRVHCAQNSLRCVLFPCFLVRRSSAQYTVCELFYLCFRVSLNKRSSAQYTVSNVFCLCFCVSLLGPVVAQNSVQCVLFVFPCFLVRRSSAQYTRWAMCSVCASMFPC